MRDPIDQFKTTVAGETVVKGDPAIGKAFGRTRTFEIFIQKALIHIITPHITNSRHLKWRQIILVAEFVYKV